MSEESKKPEEMQENGSCQEVLEEGEEAKTAESEAKEETAGKEEEAEGADKETAAETDAPEEGEETEEGKKEKKDKKTEQIEELTDRLQRSMAEFDNYRKRTEKEKAGMYVVGAKEVIEKILPVVDSFERGLASAQEGDAFAEGMQMVYKQLMTALSEMGVEPIETVGQTFDPNLHNAVMQTESDEYESGVIAQELQKGYMYRDSVVRHSMVAVVS